MRRPSLHERRWGAEEHDFAAAWRSQPNLIPAPLAGKRGIDGLEFREGKDGAAGHQSDLPLLQVATLRDDDQVARISPDYESATSAIRRRTGNTLRWCLKSANPRLARRHLGDLALWPHGADIANTVPNSFPTQHKGFRTPRWITAIRQLIS